MSGKINVSTKWTDTLKKCVNSTIYQSNSECFTFNYHLDLNTFCYGFFDSLVNRKCAEFCSQSVVAELLAKLKRDTSPYRIEQLFKEVFATVNSDYYMSLEHELDTLLPQDLQSYSTACLALIFDNHFFVAKLGCDPYVLLFDRKNGEEIYRFLNAMTADVSPKFLGNFNHSKIVENESNAANQSTNLHFEPSLDIFELIENSWQFVIIFSGEILFALRAKYQNLSSNQDIAKVIVTETIMQLSQNGNIENLSEMIVKKLLEGQQAGDGCEQQRKPNVFFILRLMNYSVNGNGYESNSNTLISTSQTTKSSTLTNAVTASPAPVTKTGEDERIDAYVDFSDFEECKAIAKTMGLEFALDDF